MSRSLGVCGSCVRTRSAEALPRALAAHRAARRRFGLPGAPPRTPGGVLCPLCANECQLGEGERGYCGLRTARGGKLVHLAGTPRRGLVHWYRDPLPTNCVADWVCAGSRQCGCHNLAVFYSSCTLDCLFCQNWQFRRASPTTGPGASAAQLAGAARHGVCFPLR